MYIYMINMCMNVHMYVYLFIFEDELVYMHVYVCISCVRYTIWYVYRPIYLPNSLSVTVTVMAM